MRKLRRKVLGEIKSWCISYCRESHKHLMYCLAHRLPWRVYEDASEPLWWTDWASVWLSSRELDCCQVHCCLAQNYPTLENTNQLTQFHSKDRAPDHVKPAEWSWKVPGCVLILVPNNDMLFLHGYLGSFTDLYHKNTTESMQWCLCWSLLILLLFLACSMNLNISCWRDLSLKDTQTFCGGRRIRNMLRPCCDLVFNKAGVSTRKIFF